MIDRLVAAFGMQDYTNCNARPGEGLDAIVNLDPGALSLGMARLFDTIVNLLAELGYGPCPSHSLVSKLNGRTFLQPLFRCEHNSETPYPAATAMSRRRRCSPRPMTSASHHRS